MAVDPLTVIDSRVSIPDVWKNNGQEVSLTSNEINLKWTVTDGTERINIPRLVSFREETHLVTNVEVSDGWRVVE